MPGLQIKRLSIKGIVSVFALVMLLVSAYSSDIQTLPDSDKVLKIEQYFSGKSKAYGILFDRGGVPQRYFSVDLLGTWDTKTQTLTLEEDFVFNDGEQSRRVWVIRKTGPDEYRGKANDVIGEAKGFSRGNTFHWDYVLEVPYKGTSLALTIDDWLFLNDDNVLINRAEMYKFGFKVGEIVISFNRL